MPAYVVSAVERTKGWEGNYGPMIDYIVTLKDSEGNDTPGVTVPQKTTTPPVTEGQTLNGSVEPGNFGLKFKKEQGAFAGNAGGGSTWKPRDPKETAAIQRQHSQSVAVDYLRFRAAIEQIPAEWLTREGLADLIDWFQRDIARGVKLAEQDGATSQTYGKAKEPVQTGLSDVPAPAEGEFVHAEPTKVENSMFDVIS